MIGQGASHKSDSKHFHQTHRPVYKLENNQNICNWRVAGGLLVKFTKLSLKILIIGYCSCQFPHEGLQSVFCFPDESKKNVTKSEL